LVCVAYACSSANVGQAPSVELAAWEIDGSFVAEIGGQLITVPPLPAE